MAPLRGWARRRRSDPLQLDRPKFWRSDPLQLDRPKFWRSDPLQFDHPKFRWMLTVTALVLGGCAEAPPAATPTAAAPTRAARPTAVGSPRAELFFRPARSAQSEAVIVETGEQFLLPDGTLAILGMLTNPASHWVQVHAVGLLAVDSDGRPRALAEMRHGPTRLAPQESVPYLAIADQNPGHVRWQGFAGAAPTEPGADAIELVQGPELRFTPQGAPFVIGELVNRAAQPQRVELLIVLRAGSDVLTLRSLPVPLALQPGERLGFTAGEFPGAALRGVQDGAVSLQVDLRSEAVPDHSAPVPLEVRVEVFHSVGSALFVRGRLTNTRQVALETPVALAEIRRLNGELWTAGWTILPGRIQAGEQRQFVLELPQDQPLDLTTVELDLRAFGTGASE